MTPKRTKVILHSADGTKHGTVFVWIGEGVPAPLYLSAMQWNRAAKRAGLTGTQVWWTATIRDRLVAVYRMPSDG